MAYISYSTRIPDFSILNPNLNLIISCIVHGLLFLAKYTRDVDTHLHGRTLTLINICMQPYTYERIQETEPVNFRD